MTASTFIGRGQERTDAVQALDQVDSGIVWDVIGVQGSGKSTLLQRVAEEIGQLDGPPVTVLVDLSQSGLDDGFQGDCGPGASAAVLWQTFVRSRELMIATCDRLVRGYRSEDFETFRQVAAAQGKRADLYLHEHGLRVEAAAASTPSVAEQAVRASIRDFQRTVDDAFVEAWEDFTVRRRVLVTLDNFESVAKTELGHWIVRMLLRLPRMLSLVARTPGPPFAVQTDCLVQRELANFTKEEVADYLAARLGGDQLTDGLASVVHDYTDGHPGGTALAAKLILERGSEIGPKDLRRLLDRLPDDMERRWSKLVALIVDAVQDPVLRDAVGAAAVARTFDAPLLATLLGDDGDRQVAGAVKALVDHRLAQPVLQGPRPNRFRLVEFVRLALDKDLMDEDPERWRTLHSRAAGHYFQLLEKEEEELSTGTYGQWYRYERPEWQAHKQDWLHHSGRLLKRRELTRARFVLVFLESFWWWGCYEKFDFNARLIEDWERAIALWSDTATSDTFAKDQQLADALWFLLDHYPLGHRKPASAAWDDMAAKLRLVASLCGLETGAARARDREEHRQLARARAMINIFLAHTRRFRDPEDQAADRYYGLAIKTFTALGDDDWVLSWLHFETADLAIERGRIDEANELIAQSAAWLLASMEDDEDEDGTAATADVDVLDPGFGDEPTPQWDYEIIANIHRARADTLWMAGRVVESATEYGRAVANAYWLQGHPHPPDAYTHRFYVEMIECTSERIASLPGDEYDVAAEFTRAVAAELPRDTSAPPASSDPELFPRAPDPVTELRNDDSPFLDTWRRRWEHRPDPAVELRVLAGDAE